mmetsp:Transcript_9556/g.15239  ORF Transcript_9556/g.15239 Transcript_9556/m.15239 type:complete len:241 (-) Transcript_9556:189-911(-)
MKLQKNLSGLRLLACTSSVNFLLKSHRKILRPLCHYNSSLKWCSAKSNCSLLHPRPNQRMKRNSIQKPREKRKQKRKVSRRRKKRNQYDPMVSCFWDICQNSDSSTHGSRRFGATRRLCCALTMAIWICWRKSAQSLRLGNSKRSMSEVICKADHLSLSFLCNCLDFVTRTTKSSVRRCLVKLATKRLGNLAISCQSKLFKHHHRLRNKKARKRQQAQSQRPRVKFLRFCAEVTSLNRCS